MNKKTIGIILSYFLIVVDIVVGIVFVPFLLKNLGGNEYGLYKLSSNVTSYLSLISLGIGSAVTRYLIKAKTENGKTEEQRVLGLFTVIFSIIGVICLVVGGVLTTNLGVWYSDSLTSAELARMKLLVLLMVINMAIGFASSSSPNAVEIKYATPSLPSFEISSDISSALTVDRALS